jgi:archaellum component FlaC
VKGINENINIFREEFEYEKKKIENIYNLISRLEKRIEK